MKLAKIHETITMTYKNYSKKIFRTQNCWNDLSIKIVLWAKLKILIHFFFMKKCIIKIFSLNFMPLTGNQAAICPLQKSMKSKHCSLWKPWDHLSPLVLWLDVLFGQVSTLLKDSTTFVYREFLLYNLLIKGPLAHK